MVDVKYFSSKYHRRASHSKEMVHEFYLNDIFSDHGSLTDLQISWMCRTIRGKLQSQKHFLLVSMPKHSVCLPDIQKKLTGYFQPGFGQLKRNLLQGASCKDIVHALSYVNSYKRLAHRFRLWPKLDLKTRRLYTLNFSVLKGNILTRAFMTRGKVHKISVLIYVSNSRNMKYLKLSWHSSNILICIHHIKNFIFAKLINENN